METSTSPQAAIEQLYSDYYSPILRHLERLVGSREAAEDLCHETFLKAWRGWDQREAEGSTRGWLYRIATNTAYDHLRRRRRIQWSALDEEFPWADAQAAFEDQLDEATPVRDALARLPEHYRLPLVLHSCNGYDLKTIAGSLGVSQAALKSRLFRARDQFRQVYAG